jgi:hypothetical protein
MAEWQIEAVGDAERSCRAAASYDYRGVLTRLSSDHGFVDRFCALLASLPFDAYLWETPPVDRDRLSRRFEFTVIDCPALDRPADARPFRDRFAEVGETVVTQFENLGGDAQLVVPVPRRDRASADCSHLAAFSRTAPASLQRGFWQAVARATRERVSSRPVWLSTSGLGVAWLHVRLDDRPKYYAHTPYRVPPGMPTQEPTG